MIDMPVEYVYPLPETHRIQKIGAKAKNLRFLVDTGFPTPATYVCTWDAYAAYVQDDAQIVEALRAEVAGKLDMNRRYAVRSSANLEDRLESSYAGQSKSVLDVQGVDEILQAIWSIWATTQSHATQA
jgi:phosphoenolpyruvate synthase/pyruvate phosphate dikinase